VIKASNSQFSIRPRKGHDEARQGPPGGDRDAYGTTRTVNGQVTVGNIKYYALERVQPPKA